MKIVNKKDFLKLPEGTVFCKGCQWCFEDMCIKGESFENDFFYIPLYMMEANGSDQYFDRLEDSFKNGTSYPLEFCVMRDGCFDPDDIFMIFEKEDVVNLIEILSQTFK